LGLFLAQDQKIRPEEKGIPRKTTNSNEFDEMLAFWQHNVIFVIGLLLRFRLDSATSRRVLQVGAAQPIG
jgi:hypothetical protein